MLIKLLEELKMQGAISCFNKMSQTISDKEQLMIQLLEAELGHRKDCAMKRRLRQAKFPVEKEWVEINTALNPKIDFKRIYKHFDGEFVEKRRNLCLIGMQGTGKTHCLIALSRELCRRGKTVRFYTACELVNVLEEAKKELLESEAYANQIMNDSSEQDLVEAARNGLNQLNQIKQRLGF